MIDSEFGEQRVHTEGSRFIWNNWDDSLTEVLVLHQRTQDSYESHGCRDLHLSFGTFIKFSVRSVGWKCQIELRNGSARHESIHGSPALFCISDKFWHILRHHVWIGFQIFVAKGQSKVVAHVLHAFHIGLFLLMRGVATGKGWPKSKPFDGTNQHDGWLAFVSGCLGVSSMEFEEIMATNICAQIDQLLITEVRYKRLKLF